MSNAIFPALRGLKWSVSATPTFSTRKLVSKSLRSVRSSAAQYPTWKFGLSYEILRDSAPDEAGTTELEKLAGFFRARRGSFDSFLVRLSEITQNPAHSTVTGQRIGTGDGANEDFQLVAQFMGATEQVQSPAGNPVVYINGVETAAFTISNGLITFTVAPAAAAIITADFDFYFRCCFAEDDAEFAEFMYLLWECQTLELESVKL